WPLAGPLRTPHTGRPCAGRASRGSVERRQPAALACETRRPDPGNLADDTFGRPPPPFYAQRGTSRSISPRARARGIVRDCHVTRASADTPGDPGCAAEYPDPRGRGPHPGAVVGGELGVPGDPQADRVVLSGERRAREDAARNLATVRAALPRAFHRRHHARPARRAGPGRGQGQPGGADVLALASDVESLPALPARVERGRHVPDHRCDVSGGEAVLHPRPRGGRG